MAILALIALALVLSACGGDPDIVEATPERHPTLTIPGGAGAGALGEQSPATTTPGEEAAPGEATPDGQPAPEGQTPGQDAPGAQPGAGAEEGATSPGGVEEFGDFCEQNPGVPDC